MVTSSKPERLFLLVCLAVVLALFYNLAIQYVAVPSCMRYVLPDSTAYIVTSPLKALWIGASPHLEPYFVERAAGDSDTPARGFALSLKNDLDEKGIVLRTADDLASLGIDPGSNAAAAIVEHKGSPHLLVVVPVADKAMFMKTLQRYTAKPVVEQPLKRRNGGLDHAAYESGNMFLGFGDDGAALLSDDIDLLRKVLDSQRESLAYFQSSDRKSRGLSTLLPGRQGRSNAWLHGGVRMSALAVPLLTDLQFAVAMDPQALAFGARSTLPDGRSELISRLLAPGRASAAPTAAVLRRSEAAAVFADTSLPYFLRYLSSDGAAGSLSGFNTLFPGLLEELRNMTTLSHVSLATSDPSERVPGVIVGLQMSEKEADDLVFRLQSSLRLKRDREILHQAAKRYREHNDADAASSVTVEALLASGLLTPERHALWSRYQVKEGHATPDPPLGPQDFSNDSYIRRRSDDTRLQYVMPPVTEDDLAYRFAKKKDQIESDDLKLDKYRLCSGYDGGTLWLGNDADVLSRWIERTRRDPVSTDYQDVLLRTEGAFGAKLSVLALPRQLLESGQLYPDSEVNKMTRTYLSDVSQYRAALLLLTARGGEREINVFATFLRR